MADAQPAERANELRRAARPLPQGGAGTAIYGGVIDDVDQNAELRGDAWYGQPGSIGIADKMIRDPHVRKSLDVISDPLRAANWDFIPASKDPVDLEVADFCRWVFFELLNWDTVLSQVITYKRYGFSLFEVTDDIGVVPSSRFKRHPGRGIGIVLTGMHHRPSWTLRRWLQSKCNPTQLQGIEQWIVGSDGEKPAFARIAASRLLRFTEDQEGANFAGLATQRSAYGAWKTKLTLMVLDGIRHERQSNATPTMKLPPEASDAEIAKAQTILAEMRAHEKGYLLLPDGFEFTWTTTSAGDGTAIGEAIERCNRDIAFNVGAGFMLLGLSGSTGSYALSQTQQGQYQVGLEGDARFICNVFNLGADGWSPVERLVRLNYGPTVALPRMVARNMPTRDWSQVLPIVNNLGNSKFLTPTEGTERFIRDVLLMPPLDAETARAVATNSAAAAEAPPGEPSQEAPAGTPREMLNGAQFTATQGLLNAAALGQLPRDSVQALIELGLNYTPAEADRVVGEIGRTFVPKTTAAGSVETAAPVPAVVGDEEAAA